MNIDLYTRQSFLGAHAQDTLGAVTIGIVGLGGGGSHVVQQLAHIGVQHFALYDPDAIESSNLNRLIGGTLRDATSHLPKVDIARRIIAGLAPKAVITPIQRRWQDEAQPLRACDLIVGCLDSLSDRRELEVSARRFLIPYIDIGLGVSAAVSGEPPRMTGQVVLSMPGAPCFTCLGFLNDRDLAEEAANYGAAGVRPQVVWANGVLASLAVGIAVDLLTDWTASTRGPVYLSYDGNTGLVQPHPRLRYLQSISCSHFDLDEVGEPQFRAL